MHYERDKDKIYIEEQYERKLKKIRDSRKDERNSLRYQKLISATAKRIVEKDTKILNLSDYGDIAKQVYGVTNKIKAVRVKSMMNTDLAKRDINLNIQRILLDKGIDETKIVDLVQKGEGVAKSTNDYLSVAKEYKDLLRGGSQSSIKVTQTQKITDFSQFLEGTSPKKESVTVTKTITKGREDADSE